MPSHGNDGPRERASSAGTSTDDAALVVTLSRFATALVDEAEPGEMLHELTVQTSAALGLSGAGVSLARADAVQFVTAHGRSIAELERLQEEHGGPGAEALHTRKPVVAGRIAALGSRWPDYVRKATEIGVAAVAAIPMNADRGLAVLDLYHEHDHEWTPDEIAVGQLFGEITTACLLHAAAVARAERIARHLQGALDSRVIIEQAKGIVAAERGVSVDQAFLLLRKHANDHQATLRAVAEAVVHLGLRLDGGPNSG